MDRVRSVALDQRGVAWVDARGRITARMPVDAFAGEGIISEIEVLRDDLADVLHDATRARVEYVFGDTVTGSSPGRRRRRRHVRERAAAAVRARHRGRRPLLTDPAAGLRRHAGLHPLGCAMAWFSAPPTDLDGWYLMHNAPGGRVASLRPGRTQAASKAGLGLRVDPRAALPRDVDGQRALLSRAFAGVGWKAPMLVDAMATARRLRVHGRRAGAAAAVVARPGGARRRRGRLPDAADRPRHERRAGAGLRARGRAGPGARRPPRRVRPATRPSLGRTSRPRSSYRPAASTATRRAARWRSGCARRRCGR